MQLSYNWLKEIIDIDLQPEELAETLTMLGMEVEEILDFSAKYKGFVTAEVKTCEKHPDSDHLSICTVNDGEVEYNVVCGAPNVASGQKVVFGKLGAVVPSANFKLEKRKIRGVTSEGMICSQVEVLAGNDSSGIWVLDEQTELGIPIDKILGADDIVFDVFLTPNKADCLSHIGIARDLAAYLNIELKLPEINLKETGSAINDKVRVTVVDKVNCPRYAARVVENVKVVESPQWLKNKLNNIGVKPRNAIVDITNYVLFEYGQPLHAFDLDTLAGREVVVKSARENEKFTTLDDKERTLNEQMLMICDIEKPIAVAGVMGGQNSEISDDTVNILIESAYFNPSSVRKTARKLSIQSDASYRYERGVNPEGIPVAMDRAATLISEICGGDIAKGSIDIYPDPIERQIVDLRFARVDRILGFQVEKTEIISIMNRLNFKALEINDEMVKYEVPPYRVDVRQEIDIIEEIARIHNYDKIVPKYYSPINFSSEKIDDSLTIRPLKRSIAEYMATIGFNEILTQNMIDPKSAQLYTENVVKIANPLGEEMSIMRPSVVPSMLKIVRHNIRQGSPDLKLFEIGKVFRKDDNEFSENFIKGYKESEKLIIIMTGNMETAQWSNKNRNVDFYDIKGIIENISTYYRFNDRIKYKIFTDDKPGFSKNIVGIYNKKEYLGVIGEVEPKLLKQYEIKQNVFMAVIDMEPIYRLFLSNRTYTPVSPYPSSDRDLAFLVNENVNVGDMLNDIQQRGGKLLQSLSLFDIYQGKGIEKGKKSVAFSLVFGSIERTLKEKEIEKTINKIIPAIEKKYAAELRDK